MTPADLDEQRIFTEGELLITHVTCPTPASTEPASTEGSPAYQPDTDPNAAFVAAVVDTVNANQAPEPDEGQYFIVTMETISEAQYRVKARDPEDAERRVRAGESRLINTSPGKGDVLDAVLDEDQKPDDF